MRTIDQILSDYDEGLASRQGGIPTPEGTEGGAPSAPYGTDLMQKVDSLYSDIEARRAGEPQQPPMAGLEMPETFAKRAPIVSPTQGVLNAVARGVTNIAAVPFQVARAYAEQPQAIVKWGMEKLGIDDEFNKYAPLTPEQVNEAVFTGPSKAIQSFSERAFPRVQMEQTDRFQKKIQEIEQKYPDDEDKRAGAIRSAMTWEQLRQRPISRPLEIIAEGAPLFLAAALTKSPSLASALFGVVQGGQTYEAARDRGVGPAKANLIASLDALVTSKLEGIAWTKLFGNTDKGIKRLLVSAGTEGAEEIIQQLSTNVIAKYGYEKGRQIMDGVVESFIGGAGLGGIMGGLTKGSQPKINYTGRTRTQEQTTADAQAINELGPDAEGVELSNRQDEQTNIIETLAQLFGKRAVFVKGALWNGIHRGGNTLFVDEDSGIFGQPILDTFGHELSESMETDSDPEVHQLARRFDRNLKESVRLEVIEKYRQLVNAKRKARGKKELSLDEVWREYRSDILGESLTRPDFYKRLANRDQKLLTKMYLYLADMVTRLKSSLVTSDHYAVYRQLNEGELGKVLDASTETFDGWAKLHPKEAAIVAEGLSSLKGEQAAPVAAEAPPVEAGVPEPSEPVAEEPVTVAEPVAEAPAPVAEPIPAPVASEPVVEVPRAVKSPVEMTDDELDAEIEASKKGDLDVLTMVFGVSRAKRYRQLERTANSSFDTAAADRASDEMAKMEDALSQEQRDILYGKNEAATQLDTDELKAIRSARNAISGTTPRELGESLRWAMTKIGDATDPNIMTAKQLLGLAQLKRGFDIARENGWDTKEVSSYAIQAAAARFSPEDVETMLGRFITPAPPVETAPTIHAVYRADLPAISGRKQLTGVRDIGSVMGLKAELPQAPFEFYTTDKEDARTYANRDSDVVKRYEMQQSGRGREIFLSLHGHEPRKIGRIRAAKIETRNPLDLRKWGASISQHDMVSIVNDAMGNAPLPNNYTWKDVPENVISEMTRYGLFSIGTESGGKEPVWRLFRNDMTVVDAELIRQGKRDISGGGEQIRGSLFAQWLRDKGYDSVLHLHDTPTGKPVEHVVVLRSDLMEGDYDREGDHYIFKPSPASPVETAVPSPVTGQAISPAEPSPVGQGIPSGNWALGESRPFIFDPNSTKNEGRWRVADPRRITGYFRRKSTTPGVGYVIGVDPKTGKQIIQAIRFDKKVMSEGQAGEWYLSNRDRLSAEYKQVMPETTLVEGVPRATEKGTEQQGSKLERAGVGPQRKTSQAGRGNRPVGGGEVKKEAVAAPLSVEDALTRGLPVKLPVGTLKVRVTYENGDTATVGARDIDTLAIGQKIVKAEALQAKDKPVPGKITVKKEKGEAKQSVRGIEEEQPKVQALVTGLPAEAKMAEQQAKERGVRHHQQLMDQAVKDVPDLEAAKDIVKRKAMGHTVPGDTLDQQEANTILALQMVENSGDPEMIPYLMLALGTREMLGTEKAREQAARRIRFGGLVDRRVAHIMTEILGPDSAFMGKLSGKTIAEKLELARSRMKEYNRIVDSLKKAGLDVEKLSDPEVRKLLENDVEYAKYVRAISEMRSSPLDRAFEYWRNSILSGPGTQIVNAGGNIGFGGWELGIQRTLEAIANIYMKNPNAPTMSSIAAMWAAAYPALRPAFKNMVKAWQTEIPSTPGSKMETSNVAIPAKYGGRWIRIPQRLMLAADEFSKTVVGEMTVVEYAYRNAAKAGLKQDTEAFQTFIAKEISDPNSESRDMAVKEARRLAWQEEIGGLAKKLSELRNDPHTGWVFKFMFPFVVTPANIVLTGLRKSPLGILHTATMAAKGEYKGSEGQAKLITHAVENVTSLAIMALLMGYLDEKDETGLPLITGSASGTKNLGRREFETRNLPALSFRAPGSDTWISYSRMEPFATIMATTIDAINAFRIKGEEVPNHIVKSLGTNIRDKTFLQGIGDIMRTLEGDSPPDKIVTGFLSSWIPNLARAPMRASDEFVRDYRAAGKNLPARIGEKAVQQAFPVAELAPIPRRTVWGEPVRRDIEEGGSMLYQTLVPFRRQSIEGLTRVEQMLYKAQKTVPDPWFPAPLSDRTFTRNGKKYTMDDAAFDKYQELAGQYAGQLLKNVNLRYDNPQQRDVDIVKNRFEQARKRALNEIWREMMKEEFKKQMPVSATPYRGILGVQ